MKKWFHLVYILLIMIILYSCKPTQNVSENLYSVSISDIQMMGIDTLNNIQMDSMINVDKLPKYSKWQKVYLQDFETGLRYEYSTLYDKTTYIIYSVKYLKNDKLYIVKKRKTTSK